MLKIIEFIVPVMTLLQHRRVQLAFNRVKIQKEQFSDVP